MPYIEGNSLEDMIAEGPLRLDEVTDLAMQICHGLQEAHKRAIIHRDIKPANIMVTNSGQAKIMDFGLARQSGMTRLTQEGTTLGTIAYMSPEQATGGELDRRTDIWSVGVVLYEMVTGQLPFPSEYEQATIYSIINEDPEPPTALRTGVPMELERIVDKAMEKRCEDRYQHIDEMLVDLQRLKRDAAKISKKTARHMKTAGTFVSPQARKSAHANEPMDAGPSTPTSGVSGVIQKQRSISKFFMANLTEGLAVLVSVALDFYLLAMLVMGVVTWLSLKLYKPLVDFLAIICNPFLDAIRALMPENLGVDISPIIAMALIFLAKKLLAEPLLQLSNRFRRSWQRS
jgi:serine/threonine protein kinase